MKVYVFVNQCMSILYFFNCIRGGEGCVKRTPASNDLACIAMTWQVLNAAVTQVQ